jgi:hypothetical protein
MAGSLNLTSECESDRKRKSISNEKGTVQMANGMRNRTQEDKTNQKAKGKKSKKGPNLPVES